MRWSGVGKGDRVELKGREYEVVKIKPKGSSAKVTVRGAGSTFESKVPLDGKVTIVKARDKRRDDAGWYVPTKAEKKAAARDAIPAGDPALTSPPEKPGKSPWTTRRDEVEERLDKMLGAHLVGEATDETAGYYVPEVDITTVAAHLALFHGVDTSGELDAYGALTQHAAMHAAARDDGVPLKVNHWHTEKRP